MLCVAHWTQVMYNETKKLLEQIKLPVRNDLECGDIVRVL